MTEKEPQAQEQPQGQLQEQLKEQSQPEEKEVQAPQPEVQEVLKTGRRKEAIARVRLSVGKNGITVNGKPFDVFFPTINLQMQVKKALMVTEYLDKVGVRARVNGGGVAGQAGAVSLGIARGLLAIDPALRSALRKEDLLTRDPRGKERKKYGKRGARRSVQWTKR